ncbi:MAG TPA: TIGR01777 family oxidoreductase [bacterium]|nr:TIGR01777 family oxidoreductase [bacterium]
MKILVTGATGLVGTALIPKLRAAGHRVVRLVRRNPVSDSDIPWDPNAGKLDPMSIEGLDAAVHLAGENIAGGRWNEALKKKIRDSRVNGTRLLAETLAQLKTPPKTLVCASAIGFYGNRGNEVLTEESPGGSGFLAEVCADWEKASAPAERKGIRTVALRIGVILSREGGALRKMLPPFRMGLGGVVGSGRQYWSWVSIEDVCGAILHALNTPSLKGPVNTVAPQPSTNAEFTRTLGRVLRRPTVLPVPAFAARLALGEMADALLLASARVVPARLTASGYSFRHADLETALRDLLKK